MNCTSHLPSVGVWHHFCSQSMLLNSSPLKTTTIAPPGGRFCLWHSYDNNSESSDNTQQTATGIVIWFGKSTNQYHPVHGYGNPPSQQPFPGTCSFITIVHSAWHRVPNQPQEHVKDILVIHHSGKDMSSTKVVMMGDKCSPECWLHDDAWHHRAYYAYL